MESEKVKEIKKALEQMTKAKYDRFAYKDNDKFGIILYADILTLINELESENGELAKQNLGDKIVLSREEWGKCVDNENEAYYRGQHEAEVYYRNILIPRERQETAEKIIKWFKENSVCIPSDEYINEFAKQFMVETKES